MFFCLSCLFNTTNVDKKPIENNVVLEKVIFEGFNLSEKSSIEEVENEVIADEQTTVNVQIQFNYNISQNTDKTQVPESEVDSFIREARTLSKELHTEKNEELFNELDIEGYENVYLSKYAPFVDLEFSDEAFMNVYEDLVFIANNNDDIAHLYIQSEEENYENNFSVALNAGNVSSAKSATSLTGSGVKVGVLEAGGIIDEDHANISGSSYTIRKEWYYIETVSDHATQVASIIAGNNGIAPDAHILSVELAGNASSEVDWLLDNDVNIINMSYGDSTPTGKYSSKSAYMDYISINQWVTFVGSSGNEGDDTGYVLNPGLGYNVVTVGATNQSGSTLASYSSYVVVEGGHKPTLVAPSGFLIPNYSSSSFGTSFSAPYVSGCIALMMQRYTSLKLYPEKINSILAASANTMTSYTTKQSSGLNDMVGAGLIDLEAAIETYSTTYSFTNDSDAGGAVYTRSISLSAGDTIKASIFWMLNSNDSTTIDFTDYDIRLYSPSGNIVARANSTASNLELIEYTITTSGTYTLEIYQFGIRGDGDIDWGAISYYVE